MEGSFDKFLKLAAKGKGEQIRQILAKYPQLLNQASGGHNRTLLWEAVNSKRLELVEFLLKEGAHPNIPGRYRSQSFVLLKPYCIAVKKKEEGLQSLLLTYGHEKDVFSLSYLGRNEDLEKVLSAKPTLLHSPQPEEELWKVSPLHFAISGKQFSTSSLLIEKGAKVAEHSSLLYEIAGRYGRIDLLELLTQAGGIPSEVSVFSALYSEDPQIAEFFFSRGLDPNKKIAMGWPPIVYVSRGDKGEHPERIKLLLSYGANINAQTPKGLSALHAASKAGYLKVVKLLVEKGADVYIQDKRGETPLDYAQKYKRREVANFLEELR